MALHKIRITEIRVRDVYLDTDYDFEALKMANVFYDKEIIKLEKTDVVSKVIKLAEETNEG